jgi:hypothetical protein
MTTYPDMLYHAGGMPVSGMLTQGKALFVNPYKGSDGYRGRRVDQGVATVKKALSLATEKQNDVIYLESTLTDFGTNGAANGCDYITSKLTWNKDSTHLIGINAGGMYSQRSGIRSLSTATAASVAPLVLVSASNCRFENLQFMNEVASGSALGCVEVSGNRNYFKNCHFAGTGVSGADAATNFSLKLTGAQENVFENCVIGLDTVTRTAGRYEVLFVASGGNAVARNVFKNCLFVTYAGSASMTFITAGSGSMDRFNYLDHCQFMNAVSSQASTMDQGLSVHASAGGGLVLSDCLMIGVTASETVASGNVYHGKYDAVLPVTTALATS